MGKYTLIIIILISITLVGCNTNAGTVDLTLNETSAEITEVTNETIHMNNCGGKGEVRQTAERSKSVNVEYAGSFGVDKVVVNGEVSAKYGEINATAKKIELVAPAGTNMAFNIEWKEKTWIGIVTAQGKDGKANYKVSVPISVALINSQDLGCVTSNPTTETTNWVFTLEYRFPTGFWSTGSHSYSFAFSCPNETPDSVTRDFTVSDNFPPISGDVYLRWGSQKIGNLWGEVVEGINPSQSTVAAIVWEGLTKSEADWRASNCQGTISWDSGATESLSAQIPFQH